MSGGPAGSGGAEGRRSAPEPSPAPPPLAADVGIVAALPIEVGFLLDRLAKVRKYAGPLHTIYEGECGGKVVALIVSGVGRESARRGTRLLLDGHRPRWVLSAGFAGALDPTLPRLALVEADEVVDPDGGCYPIDPPPAGTDPRARRGRLLTVDAIVRTAAEKAELRRRFDAVAVDMESSAVASTCAERSVRFQSVRVVSDEAGKDLPPEVVTLLTRSGSYRVGAALRAIWNRPSSVKDFWALHEHAQEAADRLAGHVAALIARPD